MAVPVLFTKAISEKLLANGRRRRRDPESADFAPVVKLFGGGAHTFLISEANPDDPDLLYGLADVGQGCPELGYLRRSELENLRFPYGDDAPRMPRDRPTLERRGGLPLERDRWFRPAGPLSAYADAARTAGRIVTDLPSPNAPQTNVDGIGL